MKIFKFLLLLILTSPIYSCSNTHPFAAEDSNDVEKEKADLFIGAVDSNVDTRMELESDMISTRWSEGDEIAVWAHNGDSYVVDGAIFGMSYYGTELNKGVFKATIDGGMEKGSYTYIGTYPNPKKIDGTTVSYSLPSLQTGKYHDKYDIMAARAILASELDGQRSEFNLNFNHLMHAIKIEIPKDRNHLCGDIKRLKIEFPTPVVGDISFDAALYGENSDNFAVSLENGSNIVEIELENAISAGSGEYIWLFINPTMIDGNIKFTGFTSEGYQSCDISTYISKDMKAGRVTPINLTIPTEIESSIIMKIDSTNLGEPIEKVIFTAPEDCKFIGSTNNQIEVAYNAENKYEVKYYYSEMKGGNIAVKYESENAIVKGDTIKTVGMKISEPNIVGNSVPYLFYEDFSGIETFNDNDNTGTGIEFSSVGNSSNSSAISISSLSSGWTAARVGGSEGNSIRICSRYEGGGLGKASADATYNGRLDSAPLSNLKSGKSVKVNVYFKYAGGQVAWMNNTCSKYGGNLGNPVMQYGYTTSQSAFKGDTNLSTVVKSGIGLSTAQSWTTINSHTNYDIPSASNSTRMSWKVTTNRKLGSSWKLVIFAANGNHWLYVDNIKVKISK